MAINKFLRVLNGRPVSDVSFDADNIPSTDEKAGLVGTQGTPSTSNKYITEQHTTLPTLDQANAMAGTGGFPPSASDPIATKDYVDQETATVSGGRTWLDAVDTNINYIKVTSGAPTPNAGYVTGEKVLNTGDNKVYTVTGGGNFDAGVAVILDQRFIFKDNGAHPSGETTSVADDKVRQYNGATYDETDPLTGFAFCLISVDEKWYYNGSAWVPLESLFEHNETSGLLGGNGSTEYFHVTTDIADALTNSNYAITSTNVVVSSADKVKAPKKHSFSFRGGFAASQSVVIFEASGSDTKVNLPASGSVVSSVVDISGAAPSAGQLDVIVQADGSDASNTSLNLTVDNATANSNEVATAVAGLVTFTNSIGVKLISNGTWDQTTADITVYLYSVEA